MCAMKSDDSKDEAHRGYRKPTTFWRLELAHAPSEAEVDIIETELDMKMPWLHRPEEWIVGYRALPASLGEIAELRATRIEGSDGIAFEVVTSRADYDEFDLAELERSVRSVLAQIAPATSESDLQRPPASMELQPETEAGFALPGLLVLDVSWSMQHDLARFDAVFGKFIRDMRQRTLVSSSAWMGIVTFADTARSDLPLSRIADPNLKIPKLAPRGIGTNFHAAFTEALARLRADLPSLGKSDHGVRPKVFRPTIYFITDGHSNIGPDWRKPLNVIKSRSWGPNVIAFGFRDADRDVTREIASDGMAYFAADGHDPERMFEQITHVISRSVISATVVGERAAADPNVPQAVPIDPQSDRATAGLVLLDPIRKFN
jgi:uncharacterized protein YegL